MTDAFIVGSGSVYTKTVQPKYRGSLNVADLSITQIFGHYQVTGTVTRLGVPGAYRVRLYRRANGVMMGETVSDGNGAYVFTGLPYYTNDFVAVAYDDAQQTNPLNAAIADLITPEAMP